MNQKIIEGYAARLSRERGREVGRGEAEADIHATIRQVARSLAPRYTFGYHTRQDIEQDAFVLALEVLAEPDAYDPSRPLANFLYVHLGRRLYNNIRRDFYRGEPPCTCCDPADPPSSPCRKWVEWRKRNTSKRNLMRPIDIANVNDERESNMATLSAVVEDASLRELLTLIDRLLPVELRADYLRMRENVLIPKARRERVRAAVLSIIASGRHHGEHA